MIIYLIGFGGFVVIFGYMLYLIFKPHGLKIKYRTLLEKEAELNYSIKSMEQTLDTLSERHDEIIQKIKYENEKYEIATQRAEDAYNNTQRLLSSELGRAKAEFARVKELEQQRMKSELQEERETLYKKFEEEKENLQHQSKEYTKEMESIQLELKDYQAKREAVNQAILRERELEEKEDFYRIMIKDTDARDIETLRSIETHLFNKEVLNKLIYEIFIKRPLMEMEKRVLNGRRIGGIYKITYIKTGESYIGRSVDIGNRWKEHCLSSLNIGTIAHSTFHNVLADKGLQNFTWEVLEEVDKDKQSSREKYWIEFYQTDKQFNQKAGG